MNDIPHTHGARLSIIEKSLEDLTNKLQSSAASEFDKTKFESELSDMSARVESLHADYVNLEARVCALEGVVGSDSNSEEKDGSASSGS